MYYQTYENIELSLLENLCLQVFRMMLHIHAYMYKHFVVIGIIPIKRTVMQYTINVME